MPSDKEKIGKVVHLALAGLLTDGAHHKQGALEQIIATLEGPDTLERLWEQLGFERGIAP